LRTASRGITLLGAVCFWDLIKMTIQFTDDEIDTIKSIINEWGSDCPGTDYEKVKELEYKLGLSVRPTPEEIAEIF
jgi:hypothetical protein